MKKLILFIVAICSIATMFYFSSRNAEISSKQSQMILDILLNFGLETNSYFIRKFAHFIIFVVIGFCVSMFIGCYIESISLNTIISFLLASGYACIDEHIQTFIPGRNGNITDVCIDVSGVLVGIMLFMLLEKTIL